MARVRLNSNGKGAGKVFIDDRPVHMITGFTFQANVHEIDRLTLNLVMFDGGDIESEAVVTVPDSTRDTLIQLGWTPPADI